MPACTRPLPHRLPRLVPRAGALALAAAALMAQAHGPGTTVRFDGCTEFVGVAPADAARARALVPSRYTPVADAAGARLVVRVADCRAVQVGAGPARPGRVAQVGLIIVSPDGTAADPNTGINNYTLAYSTDSPALALALRHAGVPAELDAALAVESLPSTGQASAYFAAVAPQRAEGLRFTLHGTVLPPGFGTRFLANWWLTDGRRETKMATDIPAISFDFGSQMTLVTSRQQVAGQLLGTGVLQGFPLSFHGAFDSGVMAVTVSR